MSNPNEAIPFDLSTLSRERLEALCVSLWGFTDQINVANNLLVAALVSAKVGNEVRDIVNQWSAHLNQLDHQVTAFVSDLVSGRDGQSVQ
ncbi:hypothetical protein VB618_09760 [Microvirga sp. CF3062]|uniref:hypothetical protein n=1 Tax=Microvirga sp. CF3062 TaxID=3110182 RepID=UPI002E78DC94|nr:hypothetical protein [Microvirga sp. CF3062]MEE1656483.1 hypothetical protein [Microvirga sp. CF3062]